MTGSPRCQCLSSCISKPLEGEAFCKNHMKSCPRKAPLSGYEPPYEPERWNSDEVRLTHNCNSYAMNVIDSRQINKCLEDPECNVPFHQPGSISGYPKFNNVDPKTCPNMIARVMGDNNTIIPSAFELKCPKGTSKIALIIDEDQDYHFLRQDKPNAADSRGYFSQKSGALPVTDRDAKGHKIFDVQLANHNFGSSLHYDRFCGYFCVPRDRPLYMKTGGGTPIGVPLKSALALKSGLNGPLKSALALKSRLNIPLKRSLALNRSQRRTRRH